MSNTATTTTTSAPIANVVTASPFAVTNGIVTLAFDSIDDLESFEACVEQAQAVASQDIYSLFKGIWSGTSEGFTADWAVVTFRNLCGCEVTAKISIV